RCRARTGRGALRRRRRRALTAMEALARMIGVHRRADPTPEGDRSARARWTIAALAAVLAVVALFSLTAGASDASAWDVAAGWFAADGSALSERDRIIVHD